MPIPFNPPDPVYPTFGQSLGQGLLTGVQGGFSAYNDRLKQEEQAKLLQIQMFQYQQKQQEIANTNLEQNVEFSAKYGIPNERQDISKALAFRSGTGPDPKDAGLLANTDKMLALGQQRQVKAAAPRAQRPQITDVDGRRVAVTFDAEGKVANKEDMGASSSFANKAAEANAVFGVADKMLDQIEGGYRGLVSATDATGVPAQYAKKKLAELVAVFPEAKVYLDTLPSKLSYLARAGGQSGVLTDVDLELFKSGLPNESDTLETAALKMGQMRDLYESIVSSKMTAFGGHRDAKDGNGGGREKTEFSADKLKRLSELRKKKASGSLK